MNECNGTACPIDTDCIDTIGSYECSGADGYNGAAGGQYIDIDEASVCREDAVCMNTD